MRRSLLVRRRRFSGMLFFTALSWMGIGMGFDIRSGLIAKDFSGFLEKKLNAVFIGKAFKLERIGGGVLGKLTVEDFSVADTSDVSASTFSVDKIIVKYNFVNLLMRRFERSSDIYLISPKLIFNVGRDDSAGGLSFGDGVSSVSASNPLIQKAGAHPLRFHMLNGSISGVGNATILNNMSGSVTFSNSTLTFNNVKGTVFNLPVSINGRIEDPLGERPAIKLRFLAKDKYYSARIAFKNTPNKRGEGTAQGYAQFFDRIDISFNGRVNTGSKDVIELKDFSVGRLFTINGEVNTVNKAGKFMVTPKAGHIKIISNINAKNGLSLYANLNHINPFGFDILTRLNVDTALYEAKGPLPIFKGLIKTQNLIINYKPFDEIKASWLLKKDELFITSLELGDKYRLFGKLNLNRPYNMDLDLSINGAAVEDWLVFSKYAEKGDFAGLMNGRLNIQGPLKEPTTKGAFSLKDGNLRELRFDSINFNLNGKGPILKIDDSKITKADGYLYINGEIDVRKLGNRNVLEDMRIETDQKVIVWEGWDISKDTHTSEVKLNKEVAEDIDVIFKTYSNSGAVNDERKRNEIGLDYKIRKDDSINVRMKEDGAFVGVEHKIKF